MDSLSEPTGKYSITMPRDIAEAAKARSGPSGLSAYVAAAVAHQIERDNLNELISVAEAEHGPVSDEEIQARRDQLVQARREQAQRGVSRSPAVPGGALVLDGGGLAKAVQRDRAVTGWLALARADDHRMITSAATLVTLSEGAARAARRSL
ncbi:conserved hypothetical protein [Streptomyces lividans TK24]|nr:conserved hypothetical protein [Streptomyces lividans TK24]